MSQDIQKGGQSLEPTRQSSPPSAHATQEDADARAAALTGDELQALEALVPSEADQDLLDYAHGSNLELPGLIDYIKMNGALAGMVERQSRAIARYQEEITRLRQAITTITHARRSAQRARPKE